MTKRYVRNVVMQSPLTGAYYFVPKAQLLATGAARVIGKKIDVTDSIEGLFGQMLNRERARIAAAKKRKTKSP